MVLAQSEAFTSLAVENLNRTKEFYTSKLGLKILMEDVDQHMMLGTEKGSKILIYQREKSKAEHTVLGFMVDDVKSTVEKLKSKGVTMETYKGLTDEDGIADVGGTTAWFKDTEGNILNISEEREI